MQNLSLRWCHTRDVKQTKCIPMVHIWQELCVQIPNEAIGGLKGSPLPVFCLLFPLYCWKSTGKRFVKIFIYFRKTFIFSCNNKPFSATKWIRIRILKEYFINLNSFISWWQGTLPIAIMLDRDHISLSQLAHFCSRHAWANHDQEI